MKAGVFRVAFNIKNSSLLLVKDPAKPYARKKR